MSFWVRRPLASDFLIVDMGQIVPASAEMDLYEFFSYDEIDESLDLPAAFTSGDLLRIDGPGGSPVPPGTEFDALANPHSIIGEAHTGGTQGQIIYKGAANYKFLDPGADGKVLTTHGAGADPTWEVGGGGSGGLKAELLTYSDTTNKVMGPLTVTPTALDEVSLWPTTAGVQEYTLDYTVREVTGGSAPGYYVCIDTGSTAPGGGGFLGGTNPGTGISSVLVFGDKVRVIYPS